MADNMIELVASLNVDDSAKQINKVDIPLLQDKIKGIKIKCELDTDGISSIQSQLANIKINAPQIDLGVGGGSELINNVSHIVDNVEDKIEELRKNLAEKFGVSVDEIVTNTIKNAKGQINSFSFDLTKLSGEVEKFSYKVSRTKQKDKESGKDYTVTSVKAIGSRDSDKGAIQLLERATKAANTLERQMINLKAAADDVSAPRPITSQESIDKVAQAYKNAETAVDNLRTANASTFEELNNEAKKAVDELNNVIKAQRNADTAATKLRAKPIEVVKADELSNLDKFVATISNSAIPDVTNLTQRVEELRSELSEVNDKQGLVDYLNKFANVESDFKALVAQAKAVKGALRDLDNLSNNSLFQKNKSDPQVSSTLSDIEDIRKEYSQLFAEIGNAKTPEDLQKISNKLAELKPQFDKVTNSANQFKAALSLENIDAGRANRIKRLTADINSYATANKRAVESTKQMASGRSFADEWSRITTVMAKGADLTDRELKDLSADMAVFRKEAQAAGLAGESAWGKFLNSFKTMSSYITANMVFNFAKRQIRDMVNEVTEIDTAMTELRKVTEATNAEFETFAKSAGQTGRELGASISDVIDATATFARLGYSLTDSEELGRVATLYKNVGDGISEETAAEDIVSTMKAFNIEAQNSIEIVDKLNQVGNNFAISSGGIGEALKRSASALAAANNDISQSIALITTANTVAQDPTTVGQGIKTVSLRLRSTKTELEEMGEDAEGAAESVSKLRAQMLALTGVDIQLDENTYKSTYQTLLEISKVWGNLNDISRASVLEQLFGKRQANIGAAILENGELLQQVYETAQQSAGSAMREQEEYAKSIQYSIDTLKASYQDLSQTVIKSDFVKTLLNGAQEFLEVLTAIIDKFGTFPTLLASVGAVGSFNKMGFFKVVEDDATKGGNAVALFGKKLKDVIKDYQEADAGRIGENKISQALSGIIGFNQSDLSAIEKYNSLIESGVDKTEAFEMSMVGASNGAKSFVQSGKAATVGITGLSISERAATITTEALGVALNTALSFGIGLLIQAIITGITKLVNAEKEAQEKAEELRKKATETAESYKDEVESLSNLTSEYIKLATTTSDLSTQKEKLLDIQDKINDGFASEKEQVDLLNGSLSENLRLLDEQEYKEAKRTVSDLEPQYEDFQKQFDYGRQYSLLGSVDKNEAKEVAKNIEQEFIDFFNATTDYYKAEWTDPFTGESKTIYSNILNTLDHADDLSIAGKSYAEVLDNLNLIIDSYREWEGHNNDTLESLNALRDKYDELAQSENEVTTAYETAQKTIQDYNDTFNSDASQRISEILEDAKELSTTLSSSKSGAEKYSAIQQLESLENEARQLAGTNTVLKNNIDIVFNAINDGSQTAIKSVGDLRSAWFESLDEMQKDAIKNIDTMKTALQNISDGKLLSSTDFWELSKFDENHILDGAKMIGDQFKVTEEQLIQLKDVYIRKQIEQLQIQNQSLQDQIDGTNGVNDGLKEQLELQLAILQSQIAKGVNSAGDAKIIEKQKSEIDSIKKSIQAYNDDINRNNILIRQLNASLGNTADLIQAAQSRAEKLSEAFVGRIDKVIDGINDQKDALNEEKEALQDQLDILEAQADEIKGIIEDYEKVADVVKNTIQDEISAIEESYNKQIEALKAQNEEREEAINLTEKLNNLNNAKNNKVVTYTEAGGFQYGVNKEAVNKARQEYDKALIDSQIAKLEKERDSATAGFEEYAKLWENATKKATKAEEEELAARILGADWREKISEQDVEIFETYEQKYDEYGVSLNNITNIEIANVKKSIEAKDKEIKAKEDLLKEWQKYKTNVQNYVNDLKNTNKEYEDSIENITLTESSNLDERLANFERFKTEYESMINRILELQDGVGDIEVNASVKMDDFTDGIKEVVEGIGTVSEKLAEAIKELGKMPTINSAGDVKYYQATGYQHYASGGVNSSTGLAWLDGTRSKPEVVLNNQDATKLYNLLHSMPASAAQMFSSPLTRFAGLRSGNTSQSSAITITGTTINLPNVRDPQQFAREMERYLQTTLTESQITPPRS